MSNGLTLARVNFSQSEKSLLPWVGEAGVGKILVTNGGDWGGGGGSEQKRSYITNKGSE